MQCGGKLFTYTRFYLVLDTGWNTLWLGRQWLMLWKLMTACLLF